MLTSELESGIAFINIQSDCDPLTVRVLSSYHSSDQMLKKLDFPLRFLLNPYLSKCIRTPSQDSLGPRMFSFASHDLIFGTGQLSSSRKKTLSGEKSYKH